MRRNIKAAKRLHLCQDKNLKTVDIHNIYELLYRKWFMVLMSCI